MSDRKTATEKYMGSKPAWSVIIPTRNRSASLGNTLAYLAQQKLHSLLYEIIVVDNASTDGTREVVEQCREEFPSRVIKYVHTSQPGLLFSRHAGAKAASAALLTFIDDDVEVKPDYGQAIIKAFADPHVSFVCGPSRPKFLGPLPYWLDMFIEHDAEGSFCIALSLMDKGSSERAVLPRWVWGLNFSLRREVLWQLGGFHPDGVPDELLLLRGDGEYGLALAAEQAGLKARYVPGAGVTHVIPPERLTTSYFTKRFFAEGISASYTAIRKAGGMENLPPEPQPADNSAHDVMQARDAFALGYQWHQNAARSSAALLDWVCRPDYFDAEYPELPRELLTIPSLHHKKEKQTEIYGDEFYATRHKSTLYAASRILDVFFSASGLPYPATAIDIGCGVGTWLSVLHDHGTSVSGWDGPWVPSKYLAIDSQYFHRINLEQELAQPGILWHIPPADMLVTLEVAEHLPPGLAENFVDFIVSHASYVLFSAAIPGQTGNGHVNEQWPSYWARLFHKKSYYMYDIIRSSIWTDINIPFWYRQNCFVVAKSDIPVKISFDAEILNGKYNIVHPEQLSLVMQ